MASYGIVGPGDPTFAGHNSWVPSEVAAINNQDAFVGYRSLITWGTLEPTESVATDLSDYDFTVIDNLLVQLEDEAQRAQAPGPGCHAGSVQRLQTKRQQLHSELHTSQSHLREQPDQR